MRKILINITDIEKEISKEVEFNKSKGLTLATDKLLLTLFLAGHEKSWRLKILEHSKNNYLEGGIYNKDRNCYYPKDLLTNKNISEKNKLEKLFKKWGFKSL